MKKQPANRETWIYGVVVNRITGMTYAFNRDYLVLPNKPEKSLVDEYRRRAEDFSLGRAFGEGRFKPSINSEAHWDTYWFPSDKVPRFCNLEYDRDWYRETCTA
jgi:hypothetical protein